MTGELDRGGPGLRGCPVLINAAGTLTRLSGGPLAPGVLEAMVEADAVSIDMFEMQAHASRAIADATGAEAGLVTTGAAAGLLLGAAACLAGLDVGRMNRLPETDGPDEIVVARGHRNGYDHALRAAGARFVDVGFAEPLAGAGVRDTESWDYEAAITARTAALLYVARDRAEPPLPEVVEVARAHDVPVIVDAAAELPPQENLQRFVQDGADIVVFSGGKVLGGPAGTGLMAGRADLIASAALQMLDVDLRWDDWRPPPGFIDKARLRGLPRQGIGRACKVGKHEIAGLLAALGHFLAEGDDARHARWLETCRRIADGLAPQGRFIAELEGAERTTCVPRLVLHCDDAARAGALRQQMASHRPPVQTAFDPDRPHCVVINPVCIREVEIPVIVAAVSG
ncbi:aminotransferase class V-fold PLP-dependent enzyme [Psychromarinibacter sp. C21-152]|uniref:Aminotransferase class V-fold PLP-dependent enzyme n=1 Tax=Psychromarinibacter sediminicola TaxID=3033385 RepID=A0AAE3NW28_9RHOB|nr:aminotransferase class V-fold PLP-dependent enzyme [Psychromarinibacter sediminicola]MDF0602744.1 aminotransferase class V-fold PLP-dependent enzyme [Psychromarinibacter sediminicola]